MSRLSSRVFTAMSSPQLDIKDIAHLARISLTSEEAATFQGHLENILHYVEQLERVDVSGVEPTAHANPVYNVFRKDAERPGLEKDTALANAPHQANGLVIVPKVIE